MLAESESQDAKPDTDEPVIPKVEEDEEEDERKRKREDEDQEDDKDEEGQGDRGDEEQDQVQDEAVEEESRAKKAKMEDTESHDDGKGETAQRKVEGQHDRDDDDSSPIPASKEGTSIYHDADVLSGRGGGTNVHPGNRNFRDLINLHRRAYLKARKNDKPAISRAIVRTIRENNGRFLKKDEKTGLWFEIGDDAAREKTSQALRQRAPEMRKLLFDTEREEARAAAEEHLRHQRMFMGMPPGAEMMGAGIPAMPPGMAMHGGGPAMFANPAFLAMAQKNGAPVQSGQDPYAQMFPNAAFMGGNASRFQPSNAS